MIDKASDILEDLRASDLTVCVADAATTVLTFCRCFCHLLGIAVPGAKTSHNSDVLPFTDYKGRGSLLHSMIRDLLAEEGSFWASSVQDAVRCAAKSELLQPKKDELKVLLESDPMDECQLGKAVVLYKELVGSTRQVELQDTADTIQCALRNHAADVLKRASPAGVSVALVQTLREGLLVFKSTPGMLSLCKDVETWANKHQEAMSVKRLVNLMKQCTEETVDFNVLKPLLKECKKAPNLAESLKSHIDDFLSAMCATLLDQD